MYCYKAFELVISSEIELPPLKTLESCDSSLVDVTITKGTIDKNGLKDAKTKGLYYQASANQLWLHVPDVAWFHVTDGKRIVFMPEDDVDEKTIRLFLLGSCMGCILHQRLNLVIHGNAIRFGDQCVIFAGASGNGKSTLAAAFQQLGHQVLADDVSAITENGEVLPSYPQIKLWHDSIKKFNIEESNLNRIRLQVDKFAYPLEEDSFCQKPLPLAAIYLLATHNEEDFKVETLTGFNKYNPIKNNTYRPNYIKGLELESEHLKMVGKLASTTRVSRITRPSQTFDIQGLTDLISEDLRSNEII